MKAGALLAAARWEDLVEVHPSLAGDARFLWDRFLPEHGRYRWREYRRALALLEDESGAAAAVARARVRRVLGLAAEPLPAAARRRGDALAYAAESALVRDPASAARLLSRALAREARPERQAWRGYARLLSGEASGGFADLDAALAAAPDLAAARVLRAVHAERTGAPARALADLDEGLRRRPAPGLFTLRAELLWKAGREEDALADAHAAVLAHPENLGGFVRLLYLRAGAKTAADRAAEGELLLAAARSAANEPAHAAWANAVLGALLGRGDLQLAPLRLALEREPGRAWVRAFLGRALGDERTPGDRAANLRAARAELDAAAVAAPSSGWILCWRGEVRKSLGDRDGALSDMDAGLALDPDYRLGNAWRSELRAERGDADGAAEDLADCHETLRRPSFLYRRSQLRREAGKLEEAAADLAECVARSSPHAYAFTPLPWLSDAKRLAHEGNTPASSGGRAAGLRARLRGTSPAEPWRALSLAPCSIPAPPRPWRPNAQELAKLSADPGLSALWRGRDALDAGREAEAAMALAQAARLRPGLFAARAWRGEALARAGRWREALKEFEAAALLAPALPLARLWKGTALRHLGRDAQAAAELLSAARLDAPNARLVDWWLRALAVPMRSWRPARAARLDAAELELILGRPARARRLAEGERGARARLLSGAAYASQGRVREAAADWEESSRLDPAALDASLPGLLSRLPPLGAAGERAAHLALASARRRLGRWEERAAALSVARRLGAEAPCEELAPDGAPARALAARASARAGRHALALRGLAAALRLEPRLAWARMLAASLQARRGALSRALALSRAALADDPAAAGADELSSGGRSEPWLEAWRGAAARGAGRLVEARSLLDAAAAREASPLTLVWRAELRLTEGDAAGALSDLDAAGVGSLRDAEARAWRGRALCALGRCDEACREFSVAARLAPRSPWPALGAAVCLQARGRSAEALKSFARARRLAPALFPDGLDGR